jgi:Leucine-rich repeat (LRR) protein
MNFKKLHSYIANIGEHKKLIKLTWDFNPNNYSITIPSRVKIEWDLKTEDTFFRGSESYDPDLEKLGFSQVVNNDSFGSLYLNKDKSYPTRLKITIYTPIEESLVKIKLECYPQNSDSDSDSDDNDDGNGDIDAMPRLLYFHSNQDNNWFNISNWFVDEKFTNPATSLPKSIDTVVMYSSAFKSDENNIFLENLIVKENSELGVDIEVSGLAAFYDNSINNAKIIGNAIFNDNSKNKYINKDELTNRINNEIVNRLSDKIPSTTLPVYLTQDPYKDGLGEFIRNPDCWINGVENISCFSPAQLSGANWRTRAGTLITRKHIVLAAHYPAAILPGGTPFIFVSSNNMVIRRNLIKTINHPNLDILIGVLDEEVPEDIKIAKIFSSNVFEYLYSDLQLYGVGLDQEEKALVKKYKSSSRSSDYYNGYINNNGEFVVCIPFLVPCPSEGVLYVDFGKYIKHTSISRIISNELEQFDERIIAGDSGNPSFLILGNELVLITVWTSPSGGSGIGFTSDQISVLNDLIDSLSPLENYAVSTIDLTKIYNHNYDKINGIVSGSATFNDNSINNGSVNQNAIFNNYSYNLGTVNGLIDHNTVDNRQSYPITIVSTKSTGDIFGTVSSSTDYVKIVWWNGYTEIYGPTPSINWSSSCGGPGFPCRSVEDSYEYNGLNIFDPESNNTLPLGEKTITIYPCDSEGNDSGEITDFNCDNNNITHLDVSGCVMLKKLTCRNNSLTTLNIHNLKNLEELSCSNNNLNILDVGVLENLKKLNCSSCSLTSLNINNCLSLNTLICDNNQLSILDIEDKVLLTNFNCAANNLSILNIDNLNLLNYLDCSFNNLSNLNVDNNLSLSGLVCNNNNLSELIVNHLSLLKRLSCGDNPLSELNINNLVSLESLFCSNNNLSDLNLSNLNSLKQLVCKNNLLTTLNIDHLSSLTIGLDCSFNNLSSLLFSESLMLYAYCNNNNLSSLRATNTSFEVFVATNNNLSSDAMDQFLNDIGPAPRASPHAESYGLLILNNNPGSLNLNKEIAINKGYIVEND